MAVTAHRHEWQSYQSFIGATQRVVVDGSVHVSLPLVPGARYAVMCPESNVYVRQGGAGLSVTSADRVLRQGEFAFINCDDSTSNRVAVMTASGVGGFLRITRVDGTTGSFVAHRELFLQRKIGACAHLSVGPSAHIETAELVAGARYGVVCYDDDLFIAQAGTGGSAPAADDTCFYLPRGILWPVNVDGDTTNLLSVLAVNNTDCDVQVFRMDLV